MNLRTRGLVLAMEDEEVVADLPVEVLAEEVPAEVESSVAEITQDSTEVAELNAATEDAIADTETLTDISDVMDASVEEGTGLDPAAAQIAEVAVESICARLGIAGARVLPALESFGSSNSRVTATRIASEGIGDVIKKTWEAIKRAFASMWAKIVGFFTKLFDGNLKLKAAAEALGKKAAEVNSEPKAAAFENTGVYSAFGYASNGVVDASSVEVFVEQQIAMTGVLTALAADVEGSLKTAEEGFKASAKAVDVVGNINKDVAKLVSEMTGKSKGVLGKGDGKGLGAEFAGEDVHTSKVLVGGVILHIVKINGNENTSGFVKVMETSTPIKKADGTGTVKTLTKAEMVDVCKVVGDLCTATAALKQKAAQIGNIEKKFNATIDGAIKAANEVLKKDSQAAAANPDAKKSMDAARRCVSELGHICGKLFTRIPSLSMVAGRASLAYVAGSLKQYK